MPLEYCNIQACYIVFILAIRASNRAMFKLNNKIRVCNEILCQSSGLSTLGPDTWSFFNPGVEGLYERFQLLVEIRKCTYKVA